MPGPKPGALPLGDAPMDIIQFYPIKPSCQPSFFGKERRQSASELRLECEKQYFFARNAVNRERARRNFSHSELMLKQNRFMFLKHKYFTPIQWLKAAFGKCHIQHDLFRELRLLSLKKLFPKLRKEFLPSLPSLHLAKLLL